MKEIIRTEVMDDLFNLYKAYMEVVKEDCVKEDFKSMKQFEDTFENIWIKYRGI